MGGRVLALGTLAATMALGISDAAGQQNPGSTVPTVVIRDQPTCRTCSVRLEHVVTLGGVGDSSSVVPWSTVARNSRGEFYVAPMAAAGEIYQYDPDGKFKRKIGGAGQGPRGFGSHIMVAVDQADSVHVVDNDNRRWSVLGPDHRLARTTPLPGRVQRFFIGEGGVLVAHAELGTAECFGLPIHLLSADGSVDRCFGGEQGVIRRDRPYSRMRQLADAGRGLIWSTRVNRYEIDLLNSAGSVERHFVREVDWFRPWEANRREFLELAPNPR